MYGRAEWHMLSLSPAYGEAAGYNSCWWHPNQIYYWWLAVYTNGCDQSNTITLCKHGVSDAARLIPVQSLLCVSIAEQLVYHGWQRTCPTAPLTQCVHNMNPSLGCWERPIC